MSEQIENSKSFIKNAEIDLIEVLKRIWAGRKMSHKSIVVYFVMGLIIAVGITKENKSETTLLFEKGFKRGEMSELLQQFGGLTFINIGSVAEQNALTLFSYPRCD